ncbi:MAG: methyltransferase domain-containing protein, partial [Planctomycetota bacterium]
HLLQERHAGRATWLRLAEFDAAATGSANADSLPARLWHAVRADVPTLPEHQADVARLERVLRERTQRAGEFFDRVAGEWDKIGVEFETGQARQRAAASLLPPGMVFADLGCGTGYLAQALLGLCSRVICVDRSDSMLERARTRLSVAQRGTQVEFRSGELDLLPIADGEVDGLVCGMVLHHLAALERPLSEMRRVLKPGGTAVVLDLAPHREAWLHETQGHRHLGLEPSDVVAAFQRAGFVSAEIEPLDDRYRPRRDEPAKDETQPQLSMFLVRARNARA